LQVALESKKPEVAPEALPKSEPKTPDPVPPTDEIPFPTLAEPQEPNLRQEIAWIMSVTPDELRERGL